MIPDMPDTSGRQRVVVPLDGSVAAATALPVARAIAAQLHAGLTILHVNPHAALDDALLAALRNQQRDAEASELQVLTGDPGQEILRATRDPTIALVVLTTHGQRAEHGEALGEVAAQVTAHNERPVLLIRPEAATLHANSSRPLRRLLIPLDGSPTTATQLRPAITLAVHLEASVDLLHVSEAVPRTPQERGTLSAPRYVDQPQHEWPHWADEVYRRLSASTAGWPKDVPVRVFLATGEVGPVLVRFAAEHDEDGMVLVRRSELEPNRAPVLRFAFSHSPVPILLLGAAAEER